MSTIAESAHFELADDKPFFAPASSDLLDGLLGQYKLMRQRIEQVAGIFDGDLGGVFHYFIEGNRGGDGSRYSSLTAEKIFQMDGAIAALNATYWSKALALTDVLDCMPQARRDKWNAQIRDPQGIKARGHRSDGAKWEVEPLHEFNEETVRPTIRELLLSREKFFAERVDGIFRGLSSTHVTNVPEGFSKRMIISHVLSSYGTTEHSRVGLINDLRCVIAKFMGRDEPGYQSTDPIVTMARRQHGKWITMDAGMLRLKVFKVGTAHLEVHPDMAWRLNQVLASMHPLAIPAEFRTKPRKAAKAFDLMGRPLPFAVVNMLVRLRVVRHRTSEWPERYAEIQNARQFEFGDHDKAVRAEAERVLESVGGARAKLGGLNYFQFDYEPGEVLNQIVASGCIPHDKAHQFYPTPERLAKMCAELAEIGPEHSVLEPSAGNGDLAAHLPAERTTCVEVSALRCSVLKSRGLTAIEADFLDWSHERMCSGELFDRVVMNPPFSEGRAVDHLVAASTLVKPGGRLVAILPASMRGKEPLTGFQHVWSPVFSGEFVGTSVAVAILTAIRDES